MKSNGSFTKLHLTKMAVFNYMSVEGNFVIALVLHCYAFGLDKKPCPTFSTNQK